MRGKEAGGGEAGKVRNLAIGIEFKFKERNKVMWVGFEQRLVFKVIKISVYEGEGESFQPCCTRFRQGGEYYVIFEGFKVFMTCQYCSNNFRNYPITLVLNEGKGLPPHLY